MVFDAVMAAPCTVMVSYFTKKQKTAPLFFYFLILLDTPGVSPRSFSRFQFQFVWEKTKNKNDQPAIWRSIWIGAAEFICCFHVTGENFRFAVNRHLLV